MFSCNAFAQEVFLAAFADDPRSQEVWQRYRKGILEHGGSQPDMTKMLAAFLGRVPDFDALTKSMARQWDKSLDS
jgi:metallopeptidase MepB